MLPAGIRKLKILAENRFSVCLKVYYSNVLHMRNASLRHSGPDFLKKCTILSETMSKIKPFLIKRPLHKHLVKIVKTII